MKEKTQRESIPSEQKEVVAGSVSQASNTSGEEKEVQYCSCKNALTVDGPQETVQRFKKEVAGNSSRDGAVLSFERLVPIPKRVLAATCFKAAADWVKKNWGCECDAVKPIITEEYEGLVVYKFLTPCSPPLEFVAKVAQQFPTLAFELDYDKRNMRFMGFTKFCGKMREDHCVEY